MSFAGSAHFPFNSCLFSLFRHFLLVSTGIGFEPSNFRSWFDFSTKCITTLGHSMISFFLFPLFSWCQPGFQIMVWFSYQKHYRSWPFNNFHFSSFRYFLLVSTGIGFEPSVWSWFDFSTTWNNAHFPFHSCLFSSFRYFLLVSTGIGFESSDFRSCFDFSTKCITALGHSMISFFLFLLFSLSVNQDWIWTFFFFFFLVF